MSDDDGGRRDYGDDDYNGGENDGGAAVAEEGSRGRDRDRDAPRDRDRDRDRDRGRDKDKEKRHRSRKRRKHRSKSPGHKSSKRRSRSRDRGEEEPEEGTGEERSERRERDSDRDRDRVEVDRTKKRNWDAPPSEHDETLAPLPPPSLPPPTSRRGFSDAPPVDEPDAYTAHMGGFSGAPHMMGHMDAPAIIPPSRAAPNAMGFRGSGPANMNSLDKKDRTVYIGNVQPNMTDRYLREYFTTEITGTPGRRDAYGTPVVERITVNHEKFFAFVDFGTIDDAEIALGMDGVYVNGHELRIRKPNQGSNAMSEAGGEIITDGIYSENGLLSLGASAQEKLRQRFNRVSTRAPVVIAHTKVEEYDY